MRYDAEHKERTRARVIAEAAKAIRAEGPDRVGVAAIMSKAGLTHGGFYAHFASKDELITAAIDQMFKEAIGRIERARKDGPARLLATYIDFYLSPAHRDARERGCPLPSLSSDLPRLPAAARERYTEGVRDLTGRMSASLAELDRPEPDRLATSALAEMAGAVSLSRAVSDPALSDAILAQSLRSLKQKLGLEETP
ncbi:MAG TPA: TetR/AcrR family transcriptional regulator [Aliidongia sp.]|nr:TetR/AcrR family transcriptional regulator [Aliidongia sp.]